MTAPGSDGNSGAQFPHSEGRQQYLPGPRAVGLAATAHYSAPTSPTALVVTENHRRSQRGLRTRRKSQAWSGRGLNFSLLCSLNINGSQGHVYFDLRAQFHCNTLNTISDATSAHGSVATVPIGGPSALYNGSDRSRRASGRRNTLRSICARRRRSRTLTMHPFQQGPAANHSLSATLLP
jgi:hypothetical protein